MQKRTITLPTGGDLEIEMTPEFLTYVRRQFSLTEEDVITDDHIRMFVHGSVKGALDGVDSDPDWVVRNDL